MRKVFGIMLLAGVMALLLCVGVLADDLPSGVYDLTAGSGYTVTPDGTAATDAQMDALKAEDGMSGITNFYVDAVKFTVSYSKTGGSPEQFIVFVLKGNADGSPPTAPTADNMVYINQDASTVDGETATVTFSTVYPSSLEPGAAYYIFLTGADTAGFAGAQIASFKYYVPYTLGDVNRDKRINAADASLVLQHDARLLTLSGSALSAADVNKDGRYNAADASLILQKDARLIDF